MKYKQFMVLTTAVTLSLPFTAMAEEKGIKLDEVVVTATKTERKAEEVPASVTVITAEEIKAMRVTKTEEILKNVEGVDLRLHGDFTPGDVSLRGIPGTFAGATTQILVDGLQVEPILITRRKALQLISPDEIERIEIVRGPASALYGPNAVGGVINIITKKGKGTPSLDVAAGYGSHNAKSLGASAGGSLERLNFRIGASEYETDGYKPYPTRDPRWFDQVDLEGRGWKDRKYNAQVGYEISKDSDISMRFNAFDIEGDFYGGRPYQKWDMDGNTIGLQYRNRVSNILDLKVNANTADYNRSSTEDNKTTFALASRGKENEDAWLGEVQADLRLFAGNTLTAGVSYSTGGLKMQRENAAGTLVMDMRSKSEVQGYYLQDEQKFGEKVILTVGGRYDKFRLFDDKRLSGGTYKDFPETDDDVFNPRGGIRLNMTKDTSLWAAAGTAYTPAMNTLKYVGFASFHDNPDLKPEKSTSYEIGVDQKFGGFLKGKATLYQTKYDDRITAVNATIDGVTKRQYQNIGETVTKGAEVGLEAVLADYWFPFINYTYTDAEITKNPADTTIEGNRPSFIPYNKFNVGVTYDNPQIITARVAGRDVGDRYRDDQNTAANEADDFFVVDAKVSKQFSIGNYLKDINLSFAVNNIFDEKYSEFWYEEADGTNYWVEASLKF